MKCKPWPLSHKMGKWRVGFHYNDSSYVAYYPMTRMFSECARCGWVKTKDVPRWDLRD